MKWFFKPKALSLEDWDLWHTVTKCNYPVQYFMRISIPNWFHRHIWGGQFAPLTRLYEWIYFHLWPKNRHHLLSLQQNFGSFDDYRWGNLSIHEGILYANFNLICKYTEKLIRQKYLILSSSESLSSTDREVSELIEKLKSIRYYWRRQRPLMMFERDSAPNYDDGIEIDNEIKQKDIQYLNEIISLYPQLKKLGI